MSIQSTYARIKTAVLSGKRSAYFGMFVLALSPFTQIFDKLFSKKIKTRSEIGPCILIVCPPRSGGTIVFQVLSHLIPSIYISNLHQLFPTLGTKFLLRIQSRFSKKISFDNYFGYSYRLGGVNEGNGLIGNIYSKGKEEIRNEFIKFYSKMLRNKDLPLIIKNVRHYEHIEDLCNAVPEIKIIRVKRNLDQAIQSEFMAFRKLKYFHPIPESISHLYKNIEPHEFAVRQILEMNKSIERTLSQLDRSRFLEVEYEDFCLRPRDYATQIIEDFCLKDRSELRNVELPLKASFSRKISDHDAQILNGYINEIVHG